MPTFLFIFAAGILVSARALGQSVAWTDPGPIPPQAGIQLDLVFTDCQPKGGINLPSVAGLQFSGSPGRATSFSMINFQTSSSTTLSYVVQAGQVGRIQIPSFTVETDKGRATVSGLALEVAASSANRARQQNPFSPNFPFAPSPLQNQSNPGSQVVPPDAVQAATEAEPRRPYVGEVFDVNYRVVMTGNRSGRVKTTPLWDVQNFTAEAWDRGQQIGPGGSQGLQFHTKAMVPKAGLFQLPSIRQKLDIDTAAGGRSFFFTAPGSVEVEAAAAPVPLNVEPLPANAPAGFQGAVGQFGLESKLVPEQVNEGEPVTWTLTLRGTGNWPMGVELPARSVLKEIRTIQPKLRREFNGTEIFTGAIVEDLVMIPTKSGEFELPSVKFHYFDPKKKAYETAEIKPPKVVVVKQTGGLALPNPPVGTVTGLPATSKKTGSVAKGKTAQALVYGEPGLPREPVAAGGMGLPPVDRAGWMLAAMLPWLVLLGVWWRWAKKSAARTDPERPRKEALKNWKKAIQMVRLMGLTEREREKALLFWQKAVAGTLGIEGATPAWTILLSGLATMEKADQENLARCWSESENGLYGRNPNLDGGWCDQAEQLATRIDLPALKAWDWLRPRNLFPWLSAIILLGAAAAPVCAQLPAQGGTGGTEGPIELYQAGRFTEAEKIWREKVVANPRDPIAKNNLALAYFQLGEKERALAYGLSAYLISPSAATVGWNTRIFAQSADQLDRAVLGLWNEGGAEWLSARLGVFGWQAVFVLSMTGAVIGLGLGLAAGYFPRFRTLCFRLGVGTGGIGLVGLLTAVAALGVYGKLADRNAVIVVDLEPLRSIPTEVEPQAEKAYPPGSVARLEKSFLGWSKIRLPNEDAGWIRNEHIVRLY